MTGVKRPEEIDRALESLESWKHRPNEITRTFKLQTFRKSIEFVERIAEHSEAVDHHPDITIRYTSVTLTITTHSHHGVTDKDLEWAREAERIYADVGRK